MRSETAARLPVVYLVEGPVGAGKSTFARSLANEQRAVWFNLDDWYARLYRPDRPETGLMEWYAERKERCLGQILRVMRALVDVGSDVVLELGLVRRGDRERFYENMDGVVCELRVFVLDAPEEIRRSRVKARNLDRGDTFSIPIPDAIFDMASKAWEPPDDEEMDERQVQWIRTA